MPAKSTKSSKSKGCVGFVSGGVLKLNTIRVFHHDTDDLTEFAQELSSHYGNDFDIRYVTTDTPSQLFDSFLDVLDKNERLGTTTLFKHGVKETAKLLRDTSGATSCKTFSLAKKSKKSDEDNGSEEEKPKKKSSKSKKDESGDEDNGSEDEKPKKKASKSKKDESGDEDNGSEEEKPKKKSSKSKKDESDNDNDGSEDEGPKLKKKSDKSGSKSKSK